MAKNNPQQSIFDEDELLQSAIDNLKVLQERIRNNPEAALTDEEKGFVMGLGSGTQFTKPIVDVSKLEGKKVSPFAKMVMTVATTFSNAKKAFNKFNQEVAENANNKASQVKASTVKIGESVDEQVGVASLGIKEALSSAVETMGTSRQSFTSKTSMAFKQKVEGVTNGVANKIEGISSRFDDKMENGKSRFLEIYDDITLEALGMRKSAISVVDTVKAGLKAGTSKVKPFVDLFEEPWIKISFRGAKGLDVDKVSYNTGLAMGKAVNKMKSFLSDVVDQMEEVKTIKASRANEAMAARSVVEPTMSAPVAEAPVAEAPVVEPAVNAPVVEATGFVDENPSGNTPAEATPVSRKRFGAAIGSAGVTELANPAMVMQDTTGSQNPEAVASVIGATPSNVSQETPDVSVNIPGEKMENIKKPSFLKRLANAFKIEFVATEYQKDLESGSISEKIGKGVDFNGVTLISSFTRKPNGALPEPSDIFEKTEKMLMEKTGIAINDNGHYYFPKSDFNESGEAISKNKKMEILTNRVQPAYIESAKEALVFLQDVNHRVKNDPQLKRFNEFAQVVGGTKSALNLLEQAKLSGKGADALGYLNVKDLGVVYNSYNKDPMKFQESHYLLEAATLNLKTVMGVGMALNSEIYMMNGTNPEAKLFSKRFEDTILIDGSSSNNGISVRMSDIMSKAAAMDFTSVVEQKGNESIVFRESHNIVAITKLSEQSVNNYKSSVKKAAEQKYGVKSEGVPVGAEFRKGPDSETTAEEDPRRIKSEDDNSSVRVLQQNAYRFGETVEFNHLRSEGFQDSRDNQNTIPRPVSAPYMPTPRALEDIVCTEQPNQGTQMSLGSAPQPEDHLPDMPTTPETTPVLEVNRTAVEEVRAAAEPEQKAKVVGRPTGRFGR